MSVLLRIRAPLANLRNNLKFAQATRRAGTAKRPLAIVYGNCQAEPLRQILAASPQFAASFETVQIPPVHSITGSQLKILEDLLPRIGLIIGQPVSNNYRGMKLGLDQISQRACDLRLISWPSLYWEVPFPFMVYVHLQLRQAVDAPIVRYHDLRFLSCASRQLGPAEAAAFLDEYKPAADGLESIIKKSRLTTAEREQKCDIKLFSWIQEPENSNRAFWTVNHPARYVLERVAEEIHHALGLDFEKLGGRDLLSGVSAPVHPASSGRTDWVVNGKVLPQRDLLALHLDWYAAHPKALSTGLREHEERMDKLALPS